MKRQRFRSIVSILSPFVAVCFLSAQVTCWAPRQAHADTSEDLKQIEYKYYYRGKYNEAIEALRLYLEQPGLSSAEVREAREYLAASLILTGSVTEGKDQFLKILALNESYEGPDPGLFNRDIISTFEDAKTEYASMIIQQAPQVATPETQLEAVEPNTVLPEPGKKPIYKKWWFYTAIGAVALVAVAASAKEEEGEPVERKTGLITIGVVIH